MINNKVLILTGKAGQGHISIAESVGYWTSQWGFEPKLLDILPGWVETTYKLNLKTHTHTPVFKATNNKYLSGLIIRDYNKSLEERVAAICPDYKDSNIVISTHPGIHPAFAKVNIMVVPDPTVHKIYMIKPQPQHYISYWKKDRRYEFLGPLARKDFYNELKQFSKQTLKRACGFDPKKTTGIILAGGEWIGRARDYIDALGYAFDPDKYEFIFVCGSNDKFRQEKEVEYKNTNFVFLGWQNGEQMNRVLRAGDFGICFSTGSAFVIESGLCKLPLYIADTLGGQEDGYVQIVEKNGVGRYLKGNYWDKIDRLKEFAPQTSKLFSKNLDKWSNYLMNRPKDWETFFSKKIRR